MAYLRNFRRTTLLHRCECRKWKSSGLSYHSHVSPVIQRGYPLSFNDDHDFFPMFICLVLTDWAVMYPLWFNDDHDFFVQNPARISPVIQREYPLSFNDDHDFFPIFICLVWLTGLSCIPCGSTTTMTSLYKTLQGYPLSFNDDHDFFAQNPA